MTTSRADRPSLLAYRSQPCAAPENIKSEMPSAMPSESPTPTAATPHGTARGTMPSSAGSIALTPRTKRERGGIIAFHQSLPSSGFPPALPH